MLRAKSAFLRMLLSEMRYIFIRVYFIVDETDSAITPRKIDVRMREVHEKPGLCYKAQL